jgi:CBS domain-containing protein
MPRIPNHTAFKNIAINEAMRRRFLRLDPMLDLQGCIAALIKHKSNAALVEERADFGGPGVVSKSDLIAAFYSGLPLETHLGSIRNEPLHTCSDSDSLDTALDLMRRQDIRRVYVRGQQQDIIGLISASDIVGLLYTICCRCRHKGTRTRNGSEPAPLSVADVMTGRVASCTTEDSLESAIEILISDHVGALLVRDASHRPEGVISKTDLILAYRHGISLATRVADIMTRSPITVSQTDRLSLALRAMIFADVQRVFVQDSVQSDIAGVLSLTDAARSRSGSCKACRMARQEMQSFG